MSQAELAKLIRARYPITAEKFSQQSISKLEKGFEPSTTHIAEIACVLGVSAIWLAAGELPRYTSYSDPTLHRCLAILEGWSEEEREAALTILEALARRF